MKEYMSPQNPIIDNAISTQFSKIFAESSLPQASSTGPEKNAYHPVLTKGQALPPALVEVQMKVDSVVSNADSFTQDWVDNEGRADKDCLDAITSNESIAPLLKEIGLITSLLVRVDSMASVLKTVSLPDESALTEIRRLLERPDIAAILRPIDTKGK